MRVAKVTICGKRKRRKYKLKAWRPHEDMRSELRCRFGGAEFVCLVSFICQLRNALIGSSSPASRASSSRNSILFSLLLFLDLRLLAFLFLFWLGCAIDNRLHTPTTTPFQYERVKVIIMSRLQPCWMETIPKVNDTASGANFQFLVLAWHWERGRGAGEAQDTLLAGACRSTYGWQRWRSVFCGSGRDEQHKAKSTSTGW